VSKKIVFEDLGNMDYQSCWDLQEQHFQEIIRRKAYSREHPGEAGEITNRLFFVEHPPVYTLGKSGDENNLLIGILKMQEINASYVKTNRGGDITFHGPGQIVGYPILDLESFHLGLKEYIERMEEAIILTLSDYGISAGRLNGASGVWLDWSHPGKQRKICAIGVRSSRFVTMHGFAFNVNTDLNYFNHINPCGFTDKAVTSLKKELNCEQDLVLAKQRLLNHLLHLFA
jgi:lipoyl(octanoyl) transferase